MNLPKAAFSVGPLSFVRNRWKVLLGAGLVLLVLGLVILNLVRARSEVAVPVSSVVVETQEIENAVFATGTLEPAEQQEFYAVTAAILDELLVREGDQVKKGDVLGSLETKALTAELLNAEAALAKQRALWRETVQPNSEELAPDEVFVRQAKAQLQLAEADLERTQILFDQGAVPEVDLEKAKALVLQRESEYETAQYRLRIKKSPPAAEVESVEAQLRQAEAAYELARERLAKAVFRAEIDGVVLSIDTEVGRPVSAGERVLVVGRVDALDVRANIIEADSGRIEPEQEVRLTSAALPDKEFSGRVLRVAPTARKSGGGQAEQVGVTVTARVDDAQESLRPGYTVDLTIVTNPLREVTVVPYEAVVEREGEKVVFVADQGKAVLRRVEVRPANELYLEVVSGLEVGERVVLSPPEKLEDGSKIKDIRNTPARERGQ
ncbi:MAG: efflux RND transporter periplasmic adaptor subunit [Clostridia bacterium]|nr:efflux RND transporter periplasmic adaptor subunit [Clostridia bacterium]